MKTRYIKNGEWVEVNAYPTSVPGLVAWNDRDGGGWTVNHEATGHWVWCGRKKVHAMIAAEEFGKIIVDCTQEEITLKAGHRTDWWSVIQARCELADAEATLKRAQRKAEKTNPDEGL